MTNNSFLPSNDDFMLFSESFVDTNPPEEVPSIHDSDRVGSSSISAPVASQSGPQFPPAPANTSALDDTQQVVIQPGALSRASVGLFITYPQLAQTQEAAMLKATELLNLWISKCPSLPLTAMKHAYGCVEHHDETQGFHAHLVIECVQSFSVSRIRAEQVFLSHRSELPEGQSYRGEFLRNGAIAARKYVAKVQPGCPILLDPTNPLYFHPWKYAQGGKHNNYKRDQDYIAKNIALVKNLREQGPIACMEQGLFHPSQASQMIKAHQLLYKVRDNNDKIKVYWIWGDARQGKSYLARRCQSKGEKPYESGLFGKNFFLKAANTKWFDNCRGEPVMIIEDAPKGIGSEIFLYKIWLDDYIIDAEQKGGHIQVKLTHVVITSNFSPVEAFCRYNEFKNEYHNCNPQDLQAVLQRITHVWRLDNPDYMDMRSEDYHKPIVYQQQYDIYGRTPTFFLLGEERVDYTEHMIHDDE